MAMIISLCGFMGAGKSTVGKFLSNYLGTDFIDLDNMLEKRFGCSISDYFAKNGEESFRSEEYSALSEIFTKSKKNLVLALGGGTLTKPESAELVKNNSIVIYLYCSEEALYKRLVKGKAKRPLLADKSDEGLREEIRQLTAKREQIYKSAANFTVDTSIWGLNRIVGQIAELLPPPSDED